MTFAISDLKRLSKSLSEYASSKRDEGNENQTAQRKKIITEFIRQASLLSAVQTSDLDLDFLGDSSSIIVRLSKACKKILTDDLLQRNILKVFTELLRCLSAIRKNTDNSDSDEIIANALLACISYLSALSEHISTSTTAARMLCVHSLTLFCSTVLIAEAKLKEMIDEKTKLFQAAICAWHRAASPNRVIALWKNLLNKYENNLLSWLDIVKAFPEECAIGQNPKEVRNTDGTIIAGRPALHKMIITTFEKNIPLRIDNLACALCVLFAHGESAHTFCRVLANLPTQPVLRRCARILSADFALHAVLVHREQTGRSALLKKSESTKQKRSIVIGPDDDFLTYFTDEAEVELILKAEKANAEKKSEENKNDTLAKKQTTRQQQEEEQRRQQLQQKIEQQMQSDATAFEEDFMKRAKTLLLDLFGKDDDETILRVLVKFIAQEEIQRVLQMEGESLIISEIENKLSIYPDRNLVNFKCNVNDFARCLLCDPSYAHFLFPFEGADPKTKFNPFAQLSSIPFLAHSLPLTCATRLSAALHGNSGSGVIFTLISSLPGSLLLRAMMYLPELDEKVESWLLHMKVISPVEHNSSFNEKENHSHNEANKAISHSSERKGALRKSKVSFESTAPMRTKRISDDKNEDRRKKLKSSRKMSDATAEENIELNYSGDPELMVQCASHILSELVRMKKGIIHRDRSSGVRVWWEAEVKMFNERTANQNKELKRLTGGNQLPTLLTGVAKKLSLCKCKRSFPLQLLASLAICLLKNAMKIINHNDYINSMTVFHLCNIFRWIYELKDLFSETPKMILFDELGFPTVIHRVLETSNDPFAIYSICCLERELFNDVFVKDSDLIITRCDNIYKSLIDKTIRGNDIDTFTVPIDQKENQKCFYALARLIDTFASCPENDISTYYEKFLSFIHVPFCSYNSFTVEHFGISMTLLTKRLISDDTKNETCRQFTSFERNAIPPLIVIQTICYHIVKSIKAKMTIGKFESKPIFDIITKQNLMQELFALLPIVPLYTEKIVSSLLLLGAIFDFGHFKQLSVQYHCDDILCDIVVKKGDRVCCETKMLIEGILCELEPEQEKKIVELVHETISHSSLSAPQFPLPQDKSSETFSSTPCFARRRPSRCVVCAQRAADTLLRCGEVCLCTQCALTEESVCPCCGQTIADFFVVC